MLSGIGNDGSHAFRFDISSSASSASNSEMSERGVTLDELRNQLRAASASLVAAFREFHAEDSPIRKKVTVSAPAAPSSQTSLNLDLSSATSYLDSSLAGTIAQKVSSELEKFNNVLAQFRTLPDLPPQQGDEIMSGINGAFDVLDGLAKGISLSRNETDLRLYMNVGEFEQNLTQNAPVLFKKMESQLDEFLGKMTDITRSNEAASQAHNILPDQLSQVTVLMQPSTRLQPQGFFKKAVEIYNDQKESSEV